MKKLFLMAVLCLAVSAVEAKSVVFNLSNRTKVYYLLGGETNPVMKVVDGKIMVNADQYEFSNIKSFYISETDDPTAIEAVKADYSRRGNVLVAKAKAGDTVMVYSTGGAVVLTASAGADGDALIDLSSLTKGVYIVKIGKESFKISK